MRYFSVIIFTVSISTIAFAQVDTLQLVEIGSIQAPSRIRELYVEDLDGDNIKEIIICTDYYVYIYNSQTYQVEWTSPPLIRPMDLFFEDINRDGLLDLAIKDITNIRLFDPHTPQTIWTSPPLETSYRLYTIGNCSYDYDYWADVVILNRIHTPDSILHDTIKINIFYGPIFQTLNLIEIHIANFERDLGYGYERYRQSINDLKISHLSGQTAPHNRLLIFTNYTHSIYTYDPWMYDYFTDSGHLYYINPCNMQIYFYGSTGDLLTYKIEGDGNNRHIYALTKSYYTYGNMHGGYFENSKFIIELNADTLLSDSVLWYQQFHDWGGYITGDFDSSYSGEEISFISNDSVYLYNFSSIEFIWAIENTEDIDTLLFAFNSVNLFDSPQIVSRTTGQTPIYKFLDGSDGSLSATLINAAIYLANSQISELDIDGNDEILSIDEDELHIFNLDYATGIGDGSRLPYRAFLRPNYPNPFNTSTTIEYGLPEAGRVRIDIYDLLGRKVETLVDEDMRAGRHLIVWVASEYSSGVYFYRIEAADFVDTKRMVYLK